MNQKLKKIAITASSVLLLIFAFHVPSWADSYFREVVNDTISKQVEERKDEIDSQIQQNIKTALEDKETQDRVSNILREVVAAELEENGESYLKEVIRKRAPHAMPLLFPDNSTTPNNQ